MSNQAPQPNPVIAAFGKGLGFVAAIFATMPTYHFTYDWFYRYALTYSQWDYRSFWELVYITALFGAIVVSVWFALSMTLTLIKALIQLPVLLLAFFWR